MARRTGSLVGGLPCLFGLPLSCSTQCPRRLPEHRAGTAKSHDNGARLGTPPAYRNETRMPVEECAVWSVLMAAGPLRGLHKKEKSATRKCEETPLDGLGAPRGWSSRRAGQRAGSPRIACSPLMDAPGLGAFAAVGYIAIGTMHSPGSLGSRDLDLCMQVLRTEDPGGKSQRVADSHPTNGKGKARRRRRQENKAS